MGTRSWFVVCFALAASCGSDNYAELVKTTPEPAGANCSSGGTAIETGLDTNGNGLLDPSEVTGTSYVCSGTSATGELVKVVPEPAGSNCSSGGTAIESGLDLNSNGVLDSDEVTSTSYVCTGPGAIAELVKVVAEPAGAHCASGGNAIETGLDSNGNGQLDDTEVTATAYVCSSIDGPPALIRVDAEPAGAHCVAGGSAIHVGLDTNSDGVLEDSEIQTTTYACNASPPTTIEGSYTINNSFDVAALNGVTTITGDLIIAANGVTAIDVSTLQHVGGTINMQNNTAVTALSFPSLISAGVVSVGTNPMLVTASFPSLATLTSATASGITAATIELPSLTSVASGLLVFSGTTLSLGALQTVGGYLNVSGQFTSLTLDALVSVGGSFPLNAPAMTSLSAVSLQTVGGDLDWSENLMLMTASLPALHSIGGKFDASFVAMTNLTFPALQTVGSHFRLQSSSNLTAVNLPQLTHVGGTLYMFGMTNLTSVSVPMMQTAGTVDIDFCNSLASLSFNALTTAPTFIVNENAVLTSLSAPALTSASNFFNVFNNPQLPTCKVLALLAQISPAPQSVNTSGNSSTCPP